MGCFLGKPGLSGTQGAIPEAVRGDNSTYNGVDQSSVTPDDVNFQLRPLPEDPAVKKSERIYRALYDFNGLSNDDLAFKKGDLLLVVLKSQSTDWWIATNQRTEEKGYIPSNFVCRNDNSPQSQVWWFDVDRRDAERKLFQPGIKLGTFLVRDSTDKASQVLSVRATATICHYRLQQSKGQCYIADKRSFPNIQELLNHYTQQKDGLCTNLTEVCPRERPLPSFTDLEVKRSAVTTSSILGKGHFGEVRKGKLYETFDVAVKYLKPGMMSTASFLDEARTLHKLRHRKLVELIAVCSAEEPILIITELMDLGCLLDYLRRDEGRTVTFKTVVDMGAQVADGMAFLETKKYIHRDLRAANVLVDRSLNVKIADLGLARTVEREHGTTDSARSKFPIKWTAPEAAKKKDFSIKSDVWSFGILLYELVTLGKTPYPGMSGFEVMNRTEKGYRMPKPNSVIAFPGSFYEIMLHCWHELPVKRPSFSVLHEIFDDFETKPALYHSKLRM